VNLFSATTYALVVLGLISLLMAGIVGPPVFLLTLGLMLCSPFRDRLGMNFSKTTMNVAVLGILLVLGWGALYGGFSWLRQLLYFSLTLLIAKLFGPKAYRDHLQIFLISTFYLIAATIKVASIWFLVLLGVYLGLGLGYLILLNFRREASRCAPADGGLPTSELSLHEKDFGLTTDLKHLLGWSFFLRVVVCFAVVLSISAIGFLTIPRFTVQMFRQPGNLVELQSGFSERVDLGELGEIKADDTPVMKVFAEGALPRSRGGLRWRGITLDEFNGSSWSVSEQVKNESDFIFSTGHRFTLTEQKEINCRLRFELEPMNTSVAFTLPEASWLRLEPVSPSTPFPSPQVRSLKRQRLAGNLFFSAVDQLEYLYFTERQTSLGRTAQSFDIEQRLHGSTRRLAIPIAYRIGSFVQPIDEAALRRDSEPAPEEIQDVYLQLPAGMEQVYRLADSVVEDRANRYDQAEAIEDYLRGERFTYTLLPPEGSEPMTLEDFLFRTRRGHCEYYAAAMGAMLRALGIPARVANGFSAGEYNRFGHYFQVRRSDAHAWVEAYFPSHGWIPFDPTPPSAEAGFHPLRTMRQIFAVIEMGWFKYVIDYGIREQIDLFGGLFRRLRTTASWEGFRLPLPSRSKAGGRSLAAPVLLVLGGIALAIGGFLLFRRGGTSRRRSRSVRRSVGRDAQTVIEFYERLLKILARKGFARPPGQTPGEFAGEVTAAAPQLADALVNLTRIYYAVRFGQHPLTPTLRAEVQQQLRQIRQG